jgi:hypothetical protein
MCASGATQTTTGRSEGCQGCQRNAQLLARHSPVARMGRARQRMLQHRPDATVLGQTYGTCPRVQEAPPCCWPASPAAGTIRWAHSTWRLTRVTNSGVDISTHVHVSRPQGMAAPKTECQPRHIGRCLRALAQQSSHDLTPVLVTPVLVTPVLVTPLLVTAALSSRGKLDEEPGCT